MFLLTTGFVKAEERIIYEVQQVSDTKAMVSLDWLDTNKTEPIRITGYQQLDGETLVIYYDIGDEVEDKRETMIYVHNTKFPLQIMLSQTDQVEHQIFTDVPESHEYYYAIMNMYYQGVVGGYPDGTFIPDNKVTKEEFAKMFVMAAGIQVDREAPSTFRDVSNERWSKPYIMALVERGIISGNGDDTFSPEAFITIGEIAAIMDKTFLFYDTEDKTSLAEIKVHWSFSYMQSLYEANIITTGDSFIKEPTVLATRKDSALLLNRMLLSLKELK